MDNINNVNHINDNTNWSIEVEEILERIRLNSIILSNRHRKNYYEYKGYTKYFDIPVIVISVIGSSFSVGANGFIDQEIISLISCFIGMCVTILTSVKLYLHLDERLKNELEMSKYFHSLALKLFKILNLPRSQRGSDGLYLLNSKYSDYIKLVEQSALSRKCIIKDSLMEIPYGLISDDEISNMSIKEKEKQGLSKYFSFFLKNPPYNKHKPSYKEALNREKMKRKCSNNNKLNNEVIYTETIKIKDISNQTNQTINETNQTINETDHDTNNKTNQIMNKTDHDTSNQTKQTNQTINEINQEEDDGYNQYSSDDFYNDYDTKV